MTHAESLDIDLPTLPGERLNSIARITRRATSISQRRSLQPCFTFSWSSTICVKPISPIFGSQSNVSEVLRGKREINARQARTLGKRFGVSPAIFI